MLKEWFRGSSSAPEKAVSAPKQAQRMVVDAEKPLEEDTPEARRAAYENKLTELAKEGPANKKKMFSYDAVFRKAQSILLEGNGNETQEGLTLDIKRSVQNTMMSSKWVLINPQMSHWEINLQMNGFTDVLAASWNTLNRYQLLYQRVSATTGAVFVTQFMAQKQQGMLSGGVFGMLQYPWTFGGCTQVQYVKDQRFSVSHMQRLIRGLYVGSDLSVDPTTHASSLSYAVSATNPRRDAALMAEVTPSKGTWKVAGTRFEWIGSTDAAFELEYKEGKEGEMVSSINVGTRTTLANGAVFGASVIDNYRTVKATLDLPFGGEMKGMNQLHLFLNAQYDIHSGNYKQGLVITA